MPKRCMYPNCTNTSRLVRGLCYNKHYARAVELVNQGRITWEKLIEQGKCTYTRLGERGRPIDYFMDGKVNTKRSKNKCLYPDCKNNIHVRGLCNHHYQVASKVVRLNRITWKILIDLNKCAPAQHRDWHVTDWFLDK